jgi:hypothetical protein
MMQTPFCGITRMGGSVAIKRVRCISKQETVSPSRPAFHWETADIYISTCALKDGSKLHYHLFLIVIQNLPNASWELII